MKTHAEFRSDRFPPCEGEEDKVKSSPLRQVSIREEHCDNGSRCNSGTKRISATQPLSSSPVS